MRCQAASPLVVTVAVVQIPCIDENVHRMRCKAASLCTHFHTPGKETHIGCGVFLTD
ncbi:hypothetical protein HanIR_Chr04g0205461 [Helianthus annuus]|nr:hypothetical protein HanIR_Chr04g0205461 [Helianthus annuus]